MAIERADRYHYRVHWSDEDDAFIGTAAEPEFRYLSWIAETPVAALNGIREVVVVVLADIEECGQTIPEPLDEWPSVAE